MMLMFITHKEKLDPIDTAYEIHFIILKSGLSWDFDLVEFEKAGGIS